ncbi:hypothetical protein BASA81_017554 [Batrachochytrium salamandrivorans]|nr:hypothetical protein BASA81_017554 [Batrachochytrium salamandrivorans]
MAEVFEKLFPEAFISRLLEQGVRGDGRRADQVRPMHLALNVVSSTASSSVCSMGRTRVMCAIQYELTSAFPVQPRMEFEITSSNPNHAAQLAGRLSGVAKELVEVDKELWAKPLEVGFVLKCSFVVMDDDGGVFDCLVNSLSAALVELRLPTDFATTASPSSQLKIKSLDSARPVRVRKVRALSFCLLEGGDGGLVADPTEKEESVLKSTLCLVVDQAGSGQVVSLTKLGKNGLVLPSTLQQCLAIARNL